MAKPLALTSRGASDPEVKDKEIGLSSEEEELERELADVPFEEIQRAMSDGSHSSWSKHVGPQKSLGRANKNRPSEMSSKSPVGRFRQVIQVPKKVVRDPRFESLSGTLDTERFRKKYSFLFDVELPAEKEKLQKLVRKSKDPEVIEELKNHISWIDKQLKSVPPKKVESEILSEHKKKEKESAKLGKQPYYLKQSEIRKRALEKKYHELKETGKLESFMEKRRRKNSSKDHRYMPYRRSSESTQP